MIRGIQHIGVGVKDIEKTLAALSEVLGVPVPPIKGIPEKQSRVALVQIGAITMEVIQDDSENGLLATFVREKGEGIHHFCMETDDIEADVTDLKARGVEMIHQEPRIGLRDKKIAFISPDSLAGLYCELSEP
jgi:methylmalonyl-CoA epimerase